MNTFLDVHQESVSGVLATFDRLIFKGHLNSFFPNGAFERYLYNRGILLKDAASFFENETAKIKEHAMKMADDAGHPYIYLNASHTHSTGNSKEALARAIADKDGVTEGLVCVFSVLETCHSFSVVGNRATRRLEAAKRRRKCLHFYWYFIDPIFGWMHVRLQSWAPYSIQVYVNGREWMVRRLDQLGVAYTKSDNKIIHVSDFAAADRLSQEFIQIPWPTILHPLASMVNPLLPDIEQTGFNGYWWVIDQAEYATDILFKNRASLELIYKDLVDVAMTGFGAEDVMRFLGRKLHHAFTGEVTIDRKGRLEGCRIKFRLKANSIKIYDHLNVLRIETTINNPREFKVLNVTEVDGEMVHKWNPMGKSVAHFWRYAQVANAANRRLIDALAGAPLTGTATEALDSLCQPQTVDGNRIARFNPVDQKTTELFEAVLSGEHAINGFRNNDLQEKLFSDKPKDDEEAKRRTHWTSRAIAKLRGHGLIKKVRGSRLYRVTAKGVKAMWAAIRFRKKDFTIDFQSVASALA